MELLSSIVPVLAPASSTISVIPLPSTFTAIVPIPLSGTPVVPPFPNSSQLLDSTRTLCSCTGDNAPKSTGAILLTGTGRPIYPGLFDSIGTPTTTTEPTAASVLTALLDGAHPGASHTGLPAGPNTLPDVSVPSGLGAPTSSAFVAFTSAAPLIDSGRLSLLSPLTSDPGPKSISTSAFPTAAPSTHWVNVGAAGELRFQPSTIDAAVGDYVRFRFLAKNHTLSQSSFESPCRSNGGFDSGFSFYNPRNQTDITSQELVYLVRDSEPAWFFCRQVSLQDHCSAGMVFAINAGDLWPAFQAKAEGSSSEQQSLPRSIDKGLQGNQVPSPSTKDNGLGTLYFPTRPAAIPSAVQATTDQLISQGPCIHALGIKLYFVSILVPAVIIYFM